MVFPEDSDLRVHVAKSPTVEEETKFGGESHSNSDDRGKVEGFGGLGGADREFANGEGDEDEGDGGHEEAENDVAGGFDAGFPGGECATIDSLDGFIGKEEGQIGHGVENRVGHGCEEGEGARGDGTVNLEEGKENISHEGSIDGRLESEMIALIRFPRLSDMLVDRLEESLYSLILFFVKSSKFRGGSVQLKWCAVQSISLFSCIRLDGVDLARRLELQREGKWIGCTCINRWFVTFHIGLTTGVLTR